MELIFLGGDFEIRSAPIDDYYSLQWNENYYEESEFELHLAPDLFATASASEYVYNNEADEAMIITDIQASDETKRTLRLSGKGLETLLHMRVMDEADTYSGTVEDIARQAVTKYALTGDRALTLLRLGTYHGYTETAAATNKRGVFLDEWLRELLKPYEMTFRIHYDFEANALDFEVYRGLDRTQEQTDNTWAIFSTSFENLARIKYARNRSDYRNVAIVSNSDGTKRVEVDKTDGAARREIYVDADDELDTASMTQLGEQALAEYAMIETVGGDVLGSANMVYGTNYALGDRCNIEDASLGISAAVRLTQMTTVVERGVTRRIPSFGEQYLTLPQYIAREVRASSGGGSSGGGVVDLTEVWDAIDANADEIAALTLRVEALEEDKPDNNTLFLLHGESFVDSSNYDRALTNNGVVISTAQSKFGGSSLYFDGSAYVTASPIDFSDGDFTIDWWEYVTSSNSGTRFSSVYSTDSNRGGALIGYGGNKIYMSSSITGSWDILDAVTMMCNTLNQWVHWAIVRSENTLSCYLNGALYAEQTISGAIAYTPQYNMSVGAFRETNKNLFVGYIDEFRISNVARWTANFTPPTSAY